MTPLIAVAERLREIEPRVTFLFIGTRHGPERALAEAAALPFAAVSAGKLRRYWSWSNFVDPLRVLAGAWEAAQLVRRFRPHAAFGAGGFASVPPLAAAAILGVPVHIHQQDVEPGLANRLLIPLARSCSVSMAASLPHFPRRKTVLVGNPVRPSVLEGSRERALERFGLEPGVPLVLVTGGGTGALGLNHLVSAAAPRLIERCQIVHLTGRGRAVPSVCSSARYRQIEFVTHEMADLLVAADLVVARAGMGTLAELAALRKAAIIVPMPGSHQRANAAAFEALGAVVTLDQDRLTSERLAATVLDLLASPARRRALAERIGTAMPTNATDRLAALLLELLKQRAAA